MTQNFTLTDFYWNFIKSLPWYYWVIIVIGLLFGGSQRRYGNRRKYYSNSDLSPFEFISGIIFLIKKLFGLKQNNTISIYNVDKMTGRQFEKYLVKLFSSLGYQVNHVGTDWYDHRGDFGADLITQKDGIKTAIQAKCYNNLVGIDSVRQVIGARDYYKCQKAAVVTNNYFTNDAQTQAKESGIILIDRDKLMEFINKSKNI